MTSLRTTLIGLTAAALLVTPAATASATSPSAAPAGPRATLGSATTSTSFDAAARRRTFVRFLSFDHTRPWSSAVKIKGQVGAWQDGRRGALRGVRVTVYRQLDGRSTWVRLKSGYTRGDYPKFRFRLRAKANADYRVVFAGNRRFQPSRSSTHVAVHRVFGAKLRDGTGRFHGRVQPKYGNKVISLDKRSCASCGWHTVRKKRTGDRGYWGFRVRAPRSGRWWWRVSVPASTSYIRSISAVFTTERR